MERHYGLDWLRIGAFGLLIFYHIGMFFVPWDWHVKTAQPLDWVQIPMMATNAWRLALLFLISGVASRFLIAKIADGGLFARQRSARLLIPLFAGVILFVAPQPWAELQEKAGYSHGFWYFWAHDYFRFGTLNGIILPTYNHLWFVAYLWVYSMLLALGFALVPASVRAAMQRGFDRLFGGSALLWLPVVFYFTLSATLEPVFGETHALVDDWYNHIRYGSLFLFGVALAKSEPVWASVVRLWKPAAVFAVLGYVAHIAYRLIASDDAPLALEIVAGVLRTAHAWGTILALLALARLKLNHDTPARRYLTDAVFPYYIAHQTIIVVVGHALKPLQIGPALEFAIILPATVVGSLLTYELARRVPILGPVLGLKWQRAAARQPAVAA